MDTKYWGKPLWTSLFSISLTYPLKPTTDDINNYKKYFTSLRHVLPCKACKKNYKKKLVTFPIERYLKKGRKGLFIWLKKIHNSVNEDIGKEKLSTQQILEKYFINKDETNSEVYSDIISIAVLSGMLFVAFKKFRI